MGSERLDVIMKQVDKKYGEGTIIRGSQYPKLARLSTGVFSLDAAMGGGLPLGRVVIFVGNESTGKTTVAMRAAATAQQTCRHCGDHLGHDANGVVVCPQCGESGEPKRVFYADIEGTFDPPWFADLGGDNDALYLTQPEFAEQAADIVEAVIRTGEVDLVVIDSIAMMSPAIEIEKSAEDAMVGNHAKLVNRFMRAIQSGFNSLGMSKAQKPSVILVNQIREKIGVMYGSPDTMPGGRGQGFAASITVKFFARPSEGITEGTGDKAVSVGQQLRFECVKNKTFPPHKKGYFDLYTENAAESGCPKGYIDNTKSVFEYAVKKGLVEKAGAWYSYTSETFGELRAQGGNAFVTELDAQPELFAELAALTMSTVLDGYTKE